ncbi:MAG: DnaJ C-terminal domain-containing protein, partial [Planctomycetota bacterium]
CDVFVKQHAYFARRGNDVLLEAPVPFATAAMGGEVEVPTLDGKKMLKVPKGTASGQLLRMRKAGIPALNGRGRGDQIVRAVVDVPRKLTKRQEDLLREFAEIEKQQGGRKGFWEKLFGER